MSQTDALSDLLNTIELNAHTYFCNHFNKPWGIEITSKDVGIFHIVVDGICWLQEPGKQIVKLMPGDIVLFPTGGAHWISYSPGNDRLDGDYVVSKMQLGENVFSHEQTEGIAADRLNTLLCGQFSYDHSFSHPFLKELPCFIHLQIRNKPRYEWLSNITRHLAQEALNMTPGSSIMVDKLTEVMFIQIMREYMESLEASNQEGFFRALKDPQVGLALNLIHADEAGEERVETLRAKVGLSKTAFTERFTELVGMAPKSYILNLRMHKARNLLETTQLNMARIAEKAGYSSEAAFSKAFKQYHQITPGKVRKASS